MFTKPRERVRITVRVWEGQTPGRSKTFSVYGGTFDAVVDRVRALFEPPAPAGVPSPQPSAGRSRRRKCG